MKKTTLLSVLMCGLCTALYAATDMGVIITDKNVTDYAKVVNGSGGTATITIVDTNGTANAVTVYNKSQMDTALGNKASASDVTALQNRATALETATNNLTTAIGDALTEAKGYTDTACGNIQDELTPMRAAIYASIKSASLASTNYTDSATNGLWTAIPSWARASSKPSYNFSEINSKPTTLSGYGITDAKIANGVITLGSNTITPLTSYTETDPTALKPSQLTVNGTAMTTSSAAVELGQYYIKTVDGKPHLMLR